MPSPNDTQQCDHSWRHFADAVFRFYALAPGHAHSQAQARIAHEPGHGIYPLANAIRQEAILSDADNLSIHPDGGCHYWKAGGHVLNEFVTALTPLPRRIR